MTNIKLQLNRKFLVIDSPIDFELYCPEQQDGVKRRKGSWQLTIHDLLTKSHYPLNPIYNLELIYDETKLDVNDKVVFYTTDLDLGQSLRGVDGQLVTLGDEVIDTKITNLPEELNVNFVYDYYTDKSLVLYRIDKIITEELLKKSITFPILMSKSDFTIRTGLLQSSHIYHFYYDYSTSQFKLKDKFRNTIMGNLTVSEDVYNVVSCRLENDLEHSWILFCFDYYDDNNDLQTLSFDVASRSSFSGELYFYG